jgi:hypothetical protein
MSLGVMIKGSEGIVLAADSRVTLFNQFTPNPAIPNQAFLVPATFDNATKLLTVNGQDFVGAVTYGLGAFMTADGPRTMHSFIPEFEKTLYEENVRRLSVLDFATRLSDFFLGQWNTLISRPANPVEEIYFLVGGYDEHAAYGRGFQFQIPNSPTPTEQNAGAGQFGITWGGQSGVVFRLLYGFDAELPQVVQETLKLSTEQGTELVSALQRFAPAIPYQFLPLPDCVNLAVFLIKSTIKFQTITTTLRGVGGPVEAATVTRLAGLRRIRHRAGAWGTGELPNDVKQSLLLEDPNEHVFARNS